MRHVVKCYIWESMLTYLNSTHKLIALLLAIGNNHKYVSIVTGVSQATISNLKKEIVFDKQFKLFQEHYYKDLLDANAKARNIIHENLLKAIQVKVDLMNNAENESVKNKAASDIIALCGLQPSSDNPNKDKGDPNHLYVGDDEFKQASPDIPDAEKHLFLDGIITKEDMISE